MRREDADGLPLVRSRLGLDRPPDDPAEIHDGNLQDDHQEDQLPHGAGSVAPPLSSITRPSRSLPELNPHHSRPSNRTAVLSHAKISGRPFCTIVRLRVTRPNRSTTTA